ncbi:MAG: cupin domain-containing protein [Actinobacteria bacterium]|nr:cupin domain-containing protein [Actinomycetota bacterium]
MSQPDLTPELEKQRRTSRLYAFSPDFNWEGVKFERYKPEGNDWGGIVRQVVAGHSEQTAFHLRYFEIAPGGNSSLEKHVHSHVVVGVRGEGKVIVGAECWDLGFLDTIYISPDTPHQLVNVSDKPFGFLCLVDAERDRPRPLDPAEIEALKSNPATRDVLRTGALKLEKVGTGNS